MKAADTSPVVVGMLTVLGFGAVILLLAALIL